MSRRDGNAVVVVGAGIAGLVSAIDLASSGFRVRVLEAAAESGGKASVVRVGDAQISAGPTVLTMVWVFEELFAAAGATFRSEVQLDRESTLARHFWSDGSCLDLHGDRTRSVEAIGNLFGAKEARAYRTFCEDGRRLFEISEKAYLRSQRPTLSSLAKDFGPAGLAALARLDGHRTMWRALEQRFAEPRLRQLFGRYATYCGSSPFEAPATLNIVAHVEAEGVYRARGGMRSVVVALERLARSLGVDIVHGVRVDRLSFDGRRLNGVIAGEAHHVADAVVFNGDIAAFGKGLLGPGATSAAPATTADARSLSAVTWAMLARVEGRSLAHHNVFFSDDYFAEFDALIRRRAMPAEPTVYVCAEDRADELGSSSESSGQERLLVLTTAPPTGDEAERWTAGERERWTDAMTKQLRRLGLTIEVEACVQTTPADFEARFPATGGSLFGPRSKGAMAALSREGAATKIPGLYLAGGSVHPGPGVPMAALSGRLAANKIRADFSRPVSAA